MCLLPFFRPLFSYRIFAQITDKTANKASETSPQCQVVDAHVFGVFL